MLAAVFAASMNSTSAELNALASTTVVDVYRRLVAPATRASAQLRPRRRGSATVGVGRVRHRLRRVAPAASARSIEAVNILGSLFYGTILGVFLVAFYLRRVSAAPRCSSPRSSPRRR